MRAWALKLVGAVPRKLWLVLAGVLLAVAVVWRVYGIGYDAARAECESAAAEARADAMEDYREASQADRDLTSRWWEADREREQDVRVVEREVIRYVQKNPDVADRRCLDGRMLQLWNGIQRRSISPGDTTARGSGEGLPGGGTGSGDGRDGDTTSGANEP